MSINRVTALAASLALVSFAFSFPGVRAAARQLLHGVLTFLAIHAHDRIRG